MPRSHVLPALYAIDGWRYLRSPLAGDLRDRLPTRLGEPHRFLFELAGVDFLNLCHDDPFPDLIEYISALATLPIRGRITLTKGPLPVPCILDQVEYNG